MCLKKICVYVVKKKISPGLKYISVTFSNDKVMPKEHSYINSNGIRYINFSDGNQYTTQPGHHTGGPVGLSNPGAHMNSQGYVRHSGFQQVDSCNTEATILSNMEHGELKLLSLLSR